RTGERGCGHHEGALRLVERGRGADGLRQFDGPAHVLDRRDVPQYRPALGGKQRGGDHLECGILGALHENSSAQWCAASNSIARLGSNSHGYAAPWLQFGPTGGRVNLRDTLVLRSASCLDTWQPRVRAVQYSTGFGVCGSLPASGPGVLAEPRAFRSVMAQPSNPAALPPSWQVRRVCPGFAPGPVRSPSRPKCAPCRSSAFSGPKSAARRVSSSACPAAAASFRSVSRKLVPVSQVTAAAAWTSAYASSLDIPASTRSSRTLEV